MYTWPPYVHRWRRSPFWRWRRAKGLRASKRPAARDGGGFLATRLHTGTGPHRVKLACESMLAPMEASRQKQLSLLLLHTAAADATAAVLPSPPPLSSLRWSWDPNDMRQSAPFPVFFESFSHKHKHSTAQASTTYYVHTYLLTRLNND